MSNDQNNNWQPPPSDGEPRNEPGPSAPHEAPHDVWAPPTAEHHIGGSSQAQYADPSGGHAAPAFTAPEKKGGKGKGVVGWLAVVVVAALAGGATGAAVTDNEDSTPTRSTDTTVAPKSASTAIATPATIRSVLEKVQPAVVSISTQSATGGGSGTGMIVSSDGEVLTNNHVVSGARSIKVLIDGEKEPRNARLLGTDATIDSALIKIDDAKDLPTVTFGDSNALQVGDEVVAIGNALALSGGPSVTSGIVSAKDRSISDNTASLDDLIQTDAAINPGNSGGPLTNMAGEVVGMNTAVIRGQGGEFQNIGFSLAINAIKPAIEDLRAGKSSAIAYLGVSTVTLDEDIKARFDLTPDSGAVVDSVQANSPADEAGLSRFDVITKFDGQDVKSNDELVTLVRKKKPGDEVKITYYRGDSEKESTATLAARPAESGE